MKKIFLAFLSMLALVLTPVATMAQDANSTGISFTGNQEMQMNTPTSSQTQPQPRPDNTPVDYGSGSQNGGGHDYSGPAYQPFSVDVFGQASRGGVAASGAVGEHVDYGSFTEGQSLVNIGGSFDNCAETDCAQRRVFGEVHAAQRDQGYAMATGTTPGQATVAESIGVSGALLQYGAGFNGQCVGPCQANNSQGQPSSGTGGQ